MKTLTLTFTDEEYEYLQEFLEAPRSWWSEGRAVLRSAMERGIDTGGPRVTGHDTVWLMAHEG